MPYFFRIVLFCLVGLCSLAQAEEFLDPAIAFRPSAHAVDAQTVEIRYDIAKGYYLYRDKFRFTVQDAGPTLGAPAFPKG